MKLLLSFLGFVFTISFTNAQPCKNVKPGMSQTEVLKLVGPPIEIDTIPQFNGDRGGQITVVWQYGIIGTSGNQRVQFTGDKVDSDIIADGKKYDELLMSFQHGDFENEETS